MILGSHLERKLFANNVSGYQNFPAKKDTETHYEEKIAFLPFHMFLETKVNHKNNSIFGMAYIAIEVFEEGLREISLNAQEFSRISSVQISMMEKNSKLLCQNVSRETLESLLFQKVEHSLDSSSLIIQMPSPLSQHTKFCLHIEYELNSPKAGVYFVHKGQRRSSECDCVWTQGQDTDSSFWFPCLDVPWVKMTTEHKLIFPKAWEGVANGQKILDEIKGEHRIQIWKSHKPFAPYLMAFVVGDFAILEQKSSFFRGKIPVNCLVPKEYAETSFDLLEKTKNMMEFFSDYWNYEFPWEKYTQAFVPEFLYGGMENASITINTSEVLGTTEYRKASESCEYLVMHELAHQWFGDLVTCAYWKEGWLNEGFATLSEFLWDEHINGFESGIFYSQENFLSSYLEESQTYQRPIVANQYEFPSEVFDGHLYDKGALVLRYIRDLTGSILFKQGVSQYLKDHEFQTVSTAQFQKSFLKETGFSLDKVLSHFVYKAGHPKLTVSLSSPEAFYHNNKTTYSVSMKVEQEKEGFEFDVRVLVFFEKGGWEEQIVSIRKKSQTLTLCYDQPVAFAVFDPRGTLPAEVSVEFPESMVEKIFSQNEKDFKEKNKSLKNGSQDFPIPFSYFKYLCLKSIFKSFPTSKNIEKVKDWLRTEPSFRVRMAVYDALKQAPRNLTQDILEGAKENHPVARNVFISLFAYGDQGQAKSHERKLREIVGNKKESIVAKQQALLSLAKLYTSSLTLISEKEDAVNFAKGIVNQHLKLARSSFFESRGHLAFGALAILEVLSLPENIPYFNKICENPKEHYRVINGALNGLALLSARFEEKRYQIRPALTFYADQLFPQRVLMELIRVWERSKDSFYLSYFDRYIDRKSYGLLSMLIPRARRARDSLSSAQSINSIIEELKGLKEAKKKIEELEVQMNSIKALLGHKKNEKKVKKK